MSVFISHSSQDNVFVQQLRAELENLGIETWMDTRELSAGDALTPEITQAIANADFVLVVFSTQSINSDWVLNEIDRAKEQGKKLIPFCLPGVQHPLVKRLTGDDLVIIQHDPAQSLCLVMPQILAALGEQLPDHAPAATAQEKPLVELVLRLRNPQAVQRDNKRRLSAEAEVVYYPADWPVNRETVSNRFQFTAPLGPIETGELRWYLESYLIWPVGVFKERGETVEKQLPQWGRQLYQAALSTESARTVAQAWRQEKGEKRFSIEVDADSPEGVPEKEAAATQEAGTELLALPWELMHDDTGWLFQGGQPIHVRRRLPNRQVLSAALLSLPIRVLLVSPRPEEKGVRYIDHRVSAAPLSEALENMGCLAELTVLSPPTFPTMQKALQDAKDAGTPFHVIHFDGHGVYDRRQGLGALCFEKPADTDKLKDRAMELVYAKSGDQGDVPNLAAILRDYRIPLVFLEACQSAQSEAKIEASVAGSLLQQGVTSVVAMSHSVLVETARRFVAAFYGELAKGARVGAAMLAGQQALHGDSVRGRISGVGELRLQDWFVPVLYQEQQDPRLFQQLLPEAVKRLGEQRRRLSFGATPEPPPHHFVGRSRELLALERMLAKAPYAVLRGQGGAGKTTLACELARWLVTTGRFARAAFVSLEEIQNERAVLDAIGRQVLPQGEKWSVAEQNFDKGLQQVTRVLNDAATLIVFDNCESLFFNHEETTQHQTFAHFASFAKKLQGGKTRLLFTSRERLPEPFAAHTVELGALSPADALKLLAQVLEQRGIPLPSPASKEYDRAEKDLQKLTASLNHHARALVLLAPELARRKIHEVTEAAQEILAELDAKHPGERENSLYASIELSLRRLPGDLRDLVPGLAVFHGGAHLNVVADVLETDVDTARRLAVALIQVGLAEDAGYGHLRLDPALPLYLSTLVPTLQRENERWAAAMEQLLGFLHQQIFKDTQTAFQLTLLELPNLLALLRRRAGELAAGAYSPQQAIDLCMKLETLLAPLGRPQALAEAVALREQAAELLQQQGGGWTHAHCLNAGSEIDRLLEQGALQQAYQTAQDLLQNCLNAGDRSYSGAAYDTAMAYIKLGRVLQTGGAAQAALEPLAEAQRRFETLIGDQSAARMASACLTERGDCLTDLGRLEEAARVYEEAIALDEKRDDRRDVAAGKFQLGTVRKEQHNYSAALDAYREARDLFSTLNEPGSVATVWHQTGMVYKEMRQWDEAERAYRESMQIRVQHGLSADEAASLNQLGNLYGVMGRLEEAVTFFRQAADIYAQLGDKRYEGVTRNNIANTLIKLRRHNEARHELLRAIECEEEFGHAAEPWKTWMILHNLEQAEGNAPAAAQARARAVEAYLAYRRDGGENQSGGMTVKLCAAILAGIKDNTATDGVIPQLAALAQKPDLPVYLKALIPKLQAILAGSRDPALAEDPVLDYDDAAELLLLLERL